MWFLENCTKHGEGEGLKKNIYIVVFTSRSLVSILCTLINKTQTQRHIRCLIKVLIKIRLWSSAFHMKRLGILDVFFWFERYKTQEFTSRLWYGYVHWTLIQQCYKFWLTMLILKEQRPKMSFMPRLGLWRSVVDPDWGLAHVYDIIWFYSTHL